MTVATDAVARPRSLSLLPSLLPAVAGALGGAVIGLQYVGVGHRPVASTLILAAGVVAGLAPLRVGLPAAVVLACFQATIGDFFGPPGRYWKEAFVAILVVRALRRQRLRPAELVVVAVVGLVYAGYLISGVPVLWVGWAAKILVFSLIAAWAVARLRPARTEWTATYYGLAVAVGANAILGIWQRVEGVDGLAGLGLPYGERIRQGVSGELRSFGGFTTGAPFSYALALATLAWIAFLTADRAGRRIALQTAWVPVAALAGIALSLDRLALVGLIAAALGGAIRHIGRRGAFALAGLVPVVLGGVLLGAGPSARGSFLEGFTFGSQSADTRRALWAEYGRSLSAFGSGPGSAGAAYQRAFRRTTPHFGFGVGWYPLERAPGQSQFRWMGTEAAVVVGPRGERRRRASLVFSATSLGVERILQVQLAGKTVARARIPSEGSRAVRLSVPAGWGRTLLRLAVRPGAARPGPVSPSDRRALSIRVSDLVATNVGAQSEAERIYLRVQRGGHPLAGATAGVVDNLYLSWLFQYGIVLGGLLCLVFAGALLGPMVRGLGGNPLPVTMQLWGLFIVLGALVVNIWEEFPVDFLVALGFGQLYSSLDRPVGTWLRQLGLRPVLPPGRK